MPQITILANATAVIGGQEPLPFGNDAAGPRRSLVLNLVSGTAYWGWLPTVTAAGASDAGIPLTIGVPIAFDSETLRFSQTLRVFASADAVVQYQELRHL